MNKITVNGRFEFTTERLAGELLVDGNKVDADMQMVNPNYYHIIHKLKSYNAEVVSYDATEKTAEIKVNNNIYSVDVKDQFDLMLDQLGMSNLNAAKISDLKAPMPGLVLKIFVESGQNIKKGENLFVLEAMKMENIIKAPADGLITGIKFKTGDKVEKGQVLIIF